MEVVPFNRLDFTAVLPRVLSLYVMSFLNPLDLSAAAQVSWHWRFLAEQVSLEQMGVGASTGASTGAVGQCPPSLSVTPSGLSVGREVHPERLVPPLQSRSQRVRSLEEPLHLLCLHAGLAYSAQGSRPLLLTEPGQQRSGGGGEEYGEEAETDDQRDHPGGEK